MGWGTLALCVGLVGGGSLPFPLSNLGCMEEKVASPGEGPAEPTRAGVGVLLVPPNVAVPKIPLWGGKTLTCEGKYGAIWTLLDLWVTFSFFLLKM